MRKLFAFVCLMISMTTAYQLSSQDYKNDKCFTDFFYIKIESAKDHSYLYYDVDSMRKDGYYNEKFSALWAFNNYLFTNYSNILRKDSTMARMIPDTLAIQKQFKAYLNEDFRFKEIFDKVIKHQNITPIYIDSLLKIASRFFLVHRSNGHVVFHLCALINDVLSLEQSENSPYYNAFCFMTIRNNVKNWDFFNKAIEPFKAEINDSISNERLEEIKNAVFAYLAKDEELRNMLLNEYNKKKEYLNFEIIE